MQLTVFTNNSLSKPEPCSTPDPVLGTSVMETNHLWLFGSSGLVGEAVKEESNGPKREGQLINWGNSEDGGVSGSRKTSQIKGNSCCAQVSR